MWKPLMAPLLAAVVVLAACEMADAPAPADAAEGEAQGQAQGQAQEPAPDSLVTEAAPGVLTPINRSGVRGSAELDRDGDEIMVEVEAEGLEAGARYAAQVHEGRCTDEGPVRFTLDDLVAGGDGSGSTRGEGRAEQLSADADLFVQLHAADGEAVACANLEEDARS